MGDTVKRAPRRNLIMYLKVFQEGSDQVFAHLVDISEGGLMLMSREAIPTGRDYRLSIRLPHPVDGVSEIHLGAHCLWCDHTVNDEVFDAGFRLTEIERSQRQIIEDLLDEYGLQG